MPVQVGDAPDAMRARETGMHGRTSTTADADGQLVTMLRSAQASAARGRARLTALHTEIETAVAKQHSLALDTPAGQRAFQNFLSTKRSQIAGVITTARQDGAVHASAITALDSVYKRSPLNSGPVDGLWPLFATGDDRGDAPDFKSGWGRPGNPQAIPARRRRLGDH